ncbi:MAG TPA: hypothetical protein PLY93_04200, partial [Turneriella sp.]|nr:hypothetical protein [Turneriella sp.]
PAGGAYYSYFGSSMLFTGSPGVSDGAGETNDTYIVRTPSSTTPYILTMGPHNLGAYAGLYADFTALSFIELSGAALISLIDIPLAGTSAMNSLYDKGTSLSTKAIQKWNDWKPFMIDLRATVHLSRLGIGFETPILVGYRAFGYPSLGLTEKGWYFGAVIVND